MAILITLQSRADVVHQIIKLQLVQLLLWECVFIVLRLECISVNGVPKGNIFLIVLNAVNQVMTRKIVLYSPLSREGLTVSVLVIWRKSLVFNVKRRDILLDVVRKNSA